MKKNVNSILDEFSNDKASEEIKEVVSSNSNLPHEVEAEMNYDPVYDDESSDHNSDLNEDNITDIYYNDDNVERNFPQQPSQQDQMKPLCQEELPNTESTVQTNMTAVKYYEQEEQTPEAIRESKHEEFDTPLTLPSVTPQGQLDTMLSSQANQENKQVQHVQSDSALTKDNDHDKSIKPQLQSELLSSSSSSLLLQEKGKSNTSLSSPTITIDNSEVSTTIVLENNENNNKDQGTEEEYREEEEEDHDKVDQEIGDTRTILTIHRSGDSGSESSHGSNEYDDSFTNDDNDNNNINQEEEKEEEDREQRRDVINVRPIILAGSCTSKSLSLTSDMSEELFTESEYTESRSKYTLAPRQASVEEYYHHHNNNKHKQDEQEYDESTHHDAKNLIDRRYSEK